MFTREQKQNKTNRFGCSWAWGRTKIQYINICSGDPKMLVLIMLLEALFSHSLCDVDWYMGQKHLNYSRQQVPGDTHTHRPFNGPPNHYQAPNWSIFPQICERCWHKNSVSVFMLKREFNFGETVILIKMCYRD